MTYFPVQPRYSVYIDSLGDPLDDGYIYLGKANLDPTVYPAKASWDEAGLYPITFPVRTMNGYPLRDGTPAQMYLNFADNTEYSVLINDEDGVEVFSSTTGLIGYFPSTGAGGDADTLEGHPASYFAVDSLAAHLAGAETFTGSKTHSANLFLTNNTPLQSYDSTPTARTISYVSLSDILYIGDPALPLVLRSSTNITTDKIIQVGLTGAFKGTNSGAAEVTLAAVIADVNTFANTSLPTNIRSNGTFTHNGNAILTSVDIVEGTFTPTIVGGTTAGTGTYTVQSGIYQKIGNRVHFSISMAWTAHTGTGNMLIGGLPYVPAISEVAVCAMEPDGLTYAGDFVHALVVGSVNEFRVRTGATGAVVAAVPIDTSAGIKVAGSYLTT